jgi:lysophospholipase L1-like esterase
VTTPYSPATATAIAFGATDQGYVETDGIVPWDPAVSRHNLQALADRIGILAVDQRDQAAALRRAICPAPTATVRVLACGDSITVGFGSADGQGWRSWLADLIDRQGIRPVMSTCAHGGWTRAQMAAELPAALAANTPDLVLINIGTNDWIPDSSAETAYRTAYGQMIDQILASSPTVKVACALIPISQATNIQAHEARANSAITAAVNARPASRVVLSDQRGTTSARWVFDATDGSQPPPGRLTFDGVHPDTPGYVQMAWAWRAAIQAWLPTP